MRDEPVFVFGSNLAGRHGKGAALFAAQYRGAVRGVGIGPTGNAYALPTKDEMLRRLPLDQIALHVRAFIDYARAHSRMTFEVTRIGCGLAGYSDAEIGPLFKGAPLNCMLPVKWEQYR